MSRKYRKAWESETAFSGWLCALEGDNTRAYCQLCKCSLQAHKKDIQNHGKCKKHLEAYKFSQEASASKKITNFMEKSIPEKRKVAELKIATFVAEHCSISSVDHLGTLLKDLDSSSELLRDIKLHRTKCTGLIKNVISPCMFEDLKHDIGNNNFSLIVDESTAIDSTKLMCIIIRYFSTTKKKVVTMFYRLIEIECGDADGLTAAFKNQLKHDGLKIENLVGIGVDGANVMVGAHHSFASNLKKDNTELVVIKCVCHSLHLAAEHACKCLPRNLDFIVKETYSWFSCSSKRQIDYRMLHETLTNNKPLKIDKLSGTRWLARHDAITKILEQWDILKFHFQLAKDKERCYTADHLYNMYNCQVSFVYITFLKHILYSITNLNKAFQAECANPLKLLEDLYLLLYHYLQFIIPPSRLKLVKKQDLATFKFKDFVMSTDCISFGYYFLEASKGLDQQSLSLIKSRCRDFIVCLCEQVQQRIPENVHILEKISLLSPESATSQIKPDISPIAIAFKKTCCNVDATIDEWNLLHTSKWSNLSTPDEFWAEVLECKTSAGQLRYGHIARLALTLLCLPFSNASVERAFSIVSIVKNKLRNKLHVSTLDAIIRVRFTIMEKGCIQFTPTKNMIAKFNTENVYSTVSPEIDAEAWNVLDGS